MSFLRIRHREDFGQDYYCQILNFGRHWPHPFKRRSLLQFSLSWNDYASWPYIQISSGNGRLFSFVFWIYKFGFDSDVMSRTWNFKHLEKLDNET